MTTSVISRTNVETTQIEEIEIKQRQPKQRFIFVAQLHDGRIIVGSATNAATRIAAINSGYNSAIPKALQVNRIIGVKPVTAERTLPSVVKRFCDKYGTDKVLAL